MDNARKTRRVGINMSIMYYVSYYVSTYVTKYFELFNLFLLMDISLYYINQNVQFQFESKLVSFLI